MKKNLILALVVILAIGTVLLVGNLIIIGDKVAALFPYADYVFYGIIGFLVVLFLIIPFVKVFLSPQLPALDETEVDGLPEKELRELGLLLAKNNYYIKDAGQRKMHKAGLKDYFNQHVGDKELMIRKISIELEKRYQSLNECIYTEALTAFVITGLSQNGRLDFISLLVINFRLVRKVVEASGFRPTYKQLIWVYYNVLASALLTNLSDDMLDDIDMTSFAQSIKLPAFVISSFLDGAFSALLTLRIGYITKYYVLKGRKSFDKKVARRYGIKNARKEILNVAKQGKDVLKKKMKNLITATSD